MQAFYYISEIFESYITNDELIYLIFLFGLYFLAKIDNTFITLQASYSIEIIETQIPPYPDFTVG